MYEITTINFQWHLCCVTLYVSRKIFCQSPALTLCAPTVETLAVPYLFHGLPCLQIPTNLISSTVSFYLNFNRFLDSQGPNIHVAFQTLKAPVKIDHGFLLLNSMVIYLIYLLSVLSRQLSNILHRSLLHPS